MLSRFGKTNVHASMFITPSTRVIRCTTGTNTSQMRLCARPCTATCPGSPTTTITPFIRTTGTTHELKVNLGTNRSLDLLGLGCFCGGVP